MGGTERAEPTADSGTIDTWMISTRTEMLSQTELAFSLIQIDPLFYEHPSLLSLIELSTNGLSLAKQNKDEA
jgi:hypothetical protein